MKQIEQLLLLLLRAAIHNFEPSDPALNPADWEALLKLCESHKLLPLILDTASKLPSCRDALKTIPGAVVSPEPEAPGKPWMELALEQVGRQAIQENEFLNLILFLQSRGLDPVVLKGPVCRLLYPKPLLRPSVDDDLWIPREQAEAYHAAMLDYGMRPDEPEQDPVTSWDNEYHKPGSPLFVETNQFLFDPESPVFNSFNDAFSGARDRAISCEVQDVSVKTLAPQDHLLYLILHAFKHFLYSGFGIRIVADICLFTWAHGASVNFPKLLGKCRAYRCERFTAAVYRIGEKYLDLPIPEPFAVIPVEEEALLTDILRSGLHGEEIDRMHSANLTIQAVADQSRGSSGGLRGSLFPSAQSLKGRYPYLEARPWLLPVAWISRAGDYWKNRKRYGSRSPAAALRIGRERLSLLRSYGVLDE